ncbi:hypothetical protein RRG08_018483 [Elysia crispata]|uniref:Uncharacterized protein n=1 Tax=Elysia crispata TaxID=231223 RepID=A0AAE1E278_9GAST|nr:hypothetical protein RRG08_018483 [Elysia crispata]
MCSNCGGRNHFKVKCKKFHDVSCLQPLVMWNGTEITRFDKTNLLVKKMKTGHEMRVLFTIVKNNLNCLLRLSTYKKFNLMTINKQKYLMAGTSVSKDKLRTPQEISNAS